MSGLQSQLAQQRHYVHSNRLNIVATSKRLEVHMKYSKINSIRSALYDIDVSLEAIKMAEEKIEIIQDSLDLMD